MMKIATSLSPRDRIWVTSLGRYWDRWRSGRRYGGRNDRRRYGSVRLTSITKFGTCISLRESIPVSSGE